MHAHGIVNLTRFWQTDVMKNPSPSYQRHRFPSEIISYSVWLYHRFYLSFKKVEELLAERGITVTYEPVRQWCRKFGPAYARKLFKLFLNSSSKCNSFSNKWDEEIVKELVGRFV